jgi:hypothetical protein
VADYTRNTNPNARAQGIQTLRIASTRPRVPFSDGFSASLVNDRRINRKGAPAALPDFLA